MYSRKETSWPSFPTEIVPLSQDIQKPRNSPAFRMSGVATSATSGFVRFLRITDLELLHPPMNTWAKIFYFRFSGLIFWLCFQLFFNFCTHLVHGISFFRTGSQRDVRIIRAAYFEMQRSRGYRMELVHQFIGCC